MRTFARRWFFLLLCVFLFAKPAAAFHLSPALWDFSSVPGKTMSGTIRVANDEDARKTYFISIQKFLPKGESGQQDFLPLWDTTGLPSWIFVAQSSLELQAGESRDVPFVIKVPKNASPGGYYAAIFFSSEPPVAGPQGKVVTSERTGSLILLTVEGELVHRTTVRDFSLTNRSPFRSLPVGFQTMIENSGNVHELPLGTITIKNYFGSIVARLPLNPEGGRVLPGSARRYVSIWQNGQTHPTSGFFSTAAEELRQFAIGRYTATLTINGQEEGNVLLTATFSVWPKELLICTLGIIILLVILLRLYRRWVMYRAIVT